jgi:hypothetical protein
MVALFCFLLALFASPFKSKSRLEAENSALRHQLTILRRKVRGRVQLTSGDRQPDFLPLHVVRLLAQAATLVRAKRGKLVPTPLGKSVLSDARQGSLPAILFHLAFWHVALGYFGRGLLGSATSRISSSLTRKSNGAPCRAQIRSRLRFVSCDAC